MLFSTKGPGWLDWYSMLQPTNAQEDSQAISRVERVASLSRYERKPEQKTRPGPRKISIIKHVPR